jgi:hypothetical protein
MTAGLASALRIDGGAAAAKGQVAASPDRPYVGAIR